MFVEFKDLDLGIVVVNLDRVHNFSPFYSRVDEVVGFEFYDEEDNAPLRLKLLEVGEEDDGEALALQLYEKLKKFLGEVKQFEL